MYFEVEINSKTILIKTSILPTNLHLYLADDHQVVAQGIASLLRQIPTIAAVQVFKDGHDLYQACLVQTPDIVFLDIEMPKWDGLETLKNLKIKFPALRCYMLSMLNEKAVIDNCIEKGASGYLSKDCTIEELAEAIGSEGELYFSKEVLKVLSGYSNKKKETLFQLSEPLTERELEILKWLCDGFSPKEIAEKIFLSPRTVETHKAKLMEKFDVNSVGKLISVAIKNKIV